jgi:malate dehydrogenase (oxaloacetate-decarboxylating)
VVGKQLSDCKIVICGVGAAGSAIIRLLTSGRPGELLAVDIDGIVHKDRRGMDPHLCEIAEFTNPTGVSGALADALVGADVFIGVSAPNLLGAAELTTMAPDAVVFALANPGVFRGLLDAQARDITDAMLLAASAAIADVVPEPNPSFIVPSVFDATVAPAVADAVRQATARKDVAPV